MARKTGSHSEITGPKIQQAALQLFARHGYAAVSMRQIASEVGIQAGAIYNYVPDKQSLLRELLIDHNKQVLTSAQAMPPRSDPRDALDQFVRHHLEFHIPRPDGVFISYMELRNLTPDNFSDLLVLREAYEKMLEDILVAGIAANQFSVPDAKITSYAILALLNGILDWFRPDGRLSLEGLQDEYCTLVRQLVGLRI